MLWHRAYRLRARWLIVSHKVEAAAGGHRQVNLRARLARRGGAQPAQLRHEGGQQRLVDRQLAQRPAAILFLVIDIAGDLDDARFAQLADVLARAGDRELQEVADSAQCMLERGHTLNKLLSDTFAAPGAASARTRPCRRRGAWRSERQAASR